MATGTPILTIVTGFALVLSALNWVLFVLITFLHDLPALRQLIVRAGGDPPATARALADGEKLLEGAGALAGAFPRAGAGPTAAAMSLACLIVAAIAAGVERF